MTLLFFVYPLFLTIYQCRFWAIAWLVARQCRDCWLCRHWPGMLAMSIDPLATEQSVEGHILVGHLLPLWSGFYALAQILMRFVPQEVPGMMISLYTQPRGLVILILLGAGWPG